MTEDNSYDIDELTERAKVLAEATGREESDVLADLLDDGILNNSHLNPDKDLVTQLKEAAALITTVQEINTDISNNKVLNGGPARRRAPAARESCLGDIEPEGRPHNARCGCPD